VVRALGGVENRRRSCAWGPRVAGQRASGVTRARRCCAWRRCPSGSWARP
jgi:hypothetical protein